MESDQKPAKRRAQAARLENGALQAQVLGGLDRGRIVFTAPQTAQLLLKFAEKPKGAYCRAQEEDGLRVTVGSGTRHCFSAGTENVLVYRITDSAPFALSLRFLRAGKALQMDEAMNLVGQDSCLRMELTTDDGMVSHAIRGMAVKLATCVTLYFAVAANMQTCKQLIQRAKEEK